MKAKDPSLPFKAGQKILSEGDPGKEMFIVEQGQVEIFRTADGEERRIGLLEQGDFFGEMSVIDDLPRGASARAATDCRVLAVDHATFDHMLREFPEVGIRMLRKISARVRELEAALEAKVAPAVRVKKTSAEGPAVRAAPAPDPPPFSALPERRAAAAAAQAAQPPEPQAPPAASVRQPLPPPPAPAASVRQPLPPPPAASVRQPLPPQPPPAASVHQPLPQQMPSSATADMPSRVVQMPPVPGPGMAPASPALPGTWKLVMLDTGANFTLPEKPEIRIGRFDQVTGIHPDIDLAEADSYKTTSRRHAKLVREGDRIFVCEEIGTANGTYVNGKRIGTGVNVPVADGDWIQFGGVKTILRGS